MQQEPSTAWRLGRALAIALLGAASYWGPLALLRLLSDEPTAAVLGVTTLAVYFVSMRRLSFRQRAGRNALLFVLGIWIAGPIYFAGSDLALGHSLPSIASLSFEVVAFVIMTPFLAFGDGTLDALAVSSGMLGVAGGTWEASKSAGINDRRASRIVVAALVFTAIVTWAFIPPQGMSLSKREVGVAFYGTPVAFYDSERAFNGDGTSHHKYRIPPEPLSELRLKLESLPETTVPFVADHPRSAVTKWHIMGSYPDDEDCVSFGLGSTGLIGAAGDQTAAIAREAWRALSLPKTRLAYDCHRWESGEASDVYMFILDVENGFIYYVNSNM